VPTIFFVFFSIVGVIFPTCDVGTTEVGVISSKSDSDFPRDELSHQFHLFAAKSFRRIRWQVEGLGGVNVDVSLSVPQCNSSLVEFIVVFRKIEAYLMKLRSRVQICCNLVLDFLLCRYVTLERLKIVPKCNRIPILSQRESGSGRELACKFTESVLPDREEFSMEFGSTF
jgi:hypothetical protein